MKILLLLIGFLGSTALTTLAQDDPKLRNDVTYSVHNYKHPNKAATAKRWQERKGLEVTPPSPAVHQLANYKQQMPGLPPVGGIVLPHTPSTDVTLRNYKIQRVREPKPEPVPALWEDILSEVPSAGNE